MAIVLVLVVLVAIGGGVAFFLKSKSGGEPARPASTPNAPAVPKGFDEPVDKAVLAPVLAPKLSTGLPAVSLPKDPGATEPEPEPEPVVEPAAVEPLPVLDLTEPEPVVEPTLEAEVLGDDDQDDDDDDHDDEGFDRFGAPGTRAKKVDEKLIKPMAEWGAPTDEPDTVVEPEPVAHVVEPEPEIVESEVVPEPVVEPEPVAEVVEPEPEPEVEPEPVAEVVEPEIVEPEVVEPEVVAEVVEPEPVAEVADDVDDNVIELPEPEAVPAGDAVDHVLQALINRAKDRQVGMAQVAAELVEQANLEDRELDEVLGDLLGRTEDESGSGQRLAELTLFSDEVPQRPGQLTDFARLSGTDKKKALIRVLCLLVALQQDEKLEPREGDDDDERAWPLARAVWPAKPDAEADDPDMPKRSRKDRRLTRSRGVA